jgi:hypothetical protein
VEATVHNRVPSRREDADEVDVVAASGLLNDVGEIGCRRRTRSGRGWQVVEAPFDVVVRGCSGQQPCAGGTAGLDRRGVDGRHRVSRSGDDRALRVVDSDLGQRAQIAKRLDAFPEHPPVESGRERDQRLYDRGLRQAVPQTSHERPVELDDVRVERGQSQQSGVPGSGVVDRHLGAASA